MGEGNEARFERWMAVAILLLGGILVFAEPLAGRVPAMRDFVGFTYPSRAAFRDAITSGDLSSWNPLAALGLSRLASPLHGVFYPGNLLLFLGHLETGVVVTWLAHVVFAGTGGYRLARAMHVRPTAAAVSGAIWGFGGYAVSMWYDGEKVLTTAWLPWFAWAAVRAARGRAWISAAFAVAAGTAAMIAYAGDPFLFFDAAGLAAAVILADEEVSARDVAMGLARSASAMLAGLALAAPTLLPAWLMRGDTPRAEALSASAAEAWSLQPVRIPELVLPGWFGDPFDVAHYPGGAFADDPTAQALPWAVSIYVGAAVLVFVSRVRSRRQLAALGGVALVFLFLAFGHYTPLNGLARAVVPGLSLLRYPEKHVVVVVGLLGVLASLGIERALVDGLRWYMVVTPVVAIGSSLLLAPAPLRESARAGAVHAALACVALGLAVGSARRDARLVPLIALFVVLDLAVAARPFLRWQVRPLFSSPFVDALHERAAASPAPLRLYRPRGGEFESPAMLPENAAQIFGVAPLPGFEPAHSVRLEFLMRALASHPRQLAALLAMDALLLPSSVPMSFAPRVTLRDMSLYLLPPAPRAWIVSSVKLEDAGAALASLASDAFEPRARAIVTTADEAKLVDLAAAAPGNAGECRIDTYAPAVVELDCVARQRGLVVISELDAEGWTAFVDGERAPIYTTDLALRGIVVGAGRHRIVQRYRAPGVVEGALIALATALALAGMAVIEQLREKRALAAAAGKLPPRPDSTN